MAQKDLAIFLSKLELFQTPEIKSEQYPTDSEIAAEMLWFAYMNEDIEEQTIADLGAGTGILGIGCLLLGAKKVFFVEKDKKAINILNKNTQKFDKKTYEIINKDVLDFKKKVDLVVQNPPFGTKEKHVDKKFLEKATKITKKIYTFHKVETKRFIEKTFEQLKFKMTHYFEFDFPIKKTMKHHKKKVERIKVGCWRIVKH
ncbi:DNA methylase [Candidatus Woesearchaeota archaeon]|jgi:putative methylase|nr:DNA methylase [Candidatus Woesearchaeota archaeon]|tara:strand:- start:1989 stop:2591 length:603 start_codon:yes stop_codon:yes gene_type:complete